MNLERLVADERLVALTRRQDLEPVEGRGAPVHPPTYPAPPNARVGAPRYAVNELGDGTLVCDLDSVPSQANRMEGAFAGALSHLVPRHAVQAGARRVELTRLPHRLADAAIRATELGSDIRSCFEALAAGDAAPLARLGPTSLVYGVWDSRDTRVSAPRAVSSRIEARDVSVLTRSAQYSAAFDQEALGLDDRAWRRAAEAGLAPAPATDRPGGIVVRGAIVQRSAVLLDVLRRYRARDGGGLLPAYLLALALGGLVTGGRACHLRSGCALVASGPARLEAVYADGERRPVALECEALLAELDGRARAWSLASGVALGGEPRVHRFDPALARRMLNATTRGAAGGAGDPQGPREEQDG